MTIYHDSTIKGSVPDALKVSDLVKDYQTNNFILGPLNFSLGAADTVAMIGHNGAGKTTLFQIITGNLDPTAGEVLISGKRLVIDHHELKRTLGYLAQNLGLPKWLTAEELITYSLVLHQLTDLSARLEETITLWDISSYRKKPMGSLSHGMQKRVGLALATLHDPSLLILDEPFSGLDLFHISALKKLIVERTARQKPTIISTHIAPYAALLCNRALLLKEGKMQELEEWHSLDTLQRASFMEEVFCA